MNKIVIMIMSSNQGRISQGLVSGKKNIPMSTHRRLCRVKNMLAMYLKYHSEIFLTLHKRLWSTEVGSSINNKV